MGELILKIVTAAGAKAPIRCDSVHLTVSDDRNGKKGGGYGVRPGHARALLSLETGVIEARHCGEVLLKGKAGSGFASIEQNTVTAVVEEFVEL